jgi:hypothetical protein
MNRVILGIEYHSVVESAKQGLQVWRGEQILHQPSDPGDFGSGKYYTTRRSRARGYSGSDGVIFRIILVFNNPFVIGVSEAYDLAQYYGTIHGTLEQRLAAARQMTGDFQLQGYDGFIAVSHKKWGIRSYSELEIVYYG